MSCRGGGTVVVPPGVWRTGRLILKSNVNLHLSEGAELRFSGNIIDYLPAVFTRMRGWSFTLLELVCMLMDRRILH